MLFLSNGFLVTGNAMLIRDIWYYGVDTNPWPEDGFSALSASARELFRGSAYVMSQVFLMDYNSARKFYMYCLQKQNNVRLLYCEVERGNLAFDQHTCRVFENPKYFLGYDYAQPGGIYFSSMANEVIYGETAFSEIWKPKLNCFGLLDSEEDMMQYVESRERFLRYLDSIGSTLLMEKGEFFVYRIFDASSVVL